MGSSPYLIVPARTQAISHSPSQSYSPPQTNPYTNQAQGAYSPPQQYSPPHQPFVAQYTAPQPQGAYSPPQQLPPQYSSIDNSQYLQTQQQFPPQYNTVEQPNTALASVQQKPGTSWYHVFLEQLAPHELAGLRTWFNKVDKNNSGTIEVGELQQVTFGGQILGATVAAKLVQVFDEDRNGEIDFNEYATMHKFITHMRQVYKFFHLLAGIYK